MAVSKLDEDEKGISLIDTLGGEQKLGIVNESGLYALVLSSRKPGGQSLQALDYPRGDPEHPQDRRLHRRSGDDGVDLTDLILSST